jgi:hypothetical protein
MAAMLEDIAVEEDIAAMLDRRDVTRPGEKLQMRLPYHKPDSMLPTSQRARIEALL